MWFQSKLYFKNLPFYWKTCVQSCKFAIVVSQILKPSDSLFVNLQILQFTIWRCLVSKLGWPLILGGGFANWNVPFPLIVARVLAVAGRRRCNNQRTKAVNLLSSVGTWTHLFHLLFPQVLTQKCCCALHGSTLHSEQRPLPANWSNLVIYSSEASPHPIAHQLLWPTSPGRDFCKLKTNLVHIMLWTCVSFFLCFVQR